MLSLLEPDVIALYIMRLICRLSVTGLFLVLIVVIFPLFLRVAPIEITSLHLIDSGPDHLDKTIQAARLKGARVMVTGMSDAVAEAIVDLGIDWSKVEALADLQTGQGSALAGSKSDS